jgi:hypothetical protein
MPAKKNVLVIEKCCTCRFWQSVSSGAAPVAGYCRRSPPVILDMIVEPEGDLQISDIAAATAYPVTNDDDWCGEYASPRSSFQQV